MKILKEHHKDNEIKEAIRLKAERKNGIPHIMYCERCGSKLEVLELDFDEKRDGFVSFTCPVCGKWNLIFIFSKWIGRLRMIISTWIKDKEK